VAELAYLEKAARAIEAMEQGAMLEVIQAAMSRDAAREIMGAWNLKRQGISQARIEADSAAFKAALKKARDARSD